MSSEFDYENQDDFQDSGSTGELNIQSVDISECKEIQQPAPLQASLCRKGVFVIMKDNPCKVADLKISKTGKHGSSKANMMGYDIITNRKYQETVPGHATMWGYTPAKIEYEVADISNGMITAITADGQEKEFQLPSTEVGEKLLADFKANAEKGGDAFFIITVLYAPRMVGKKWVANMFVEAYKNGKSE